MSQSYIRFSGVENSFMCYPLRMEELDMDIVDLQKAFNDFSEAYQEVNEGQNSSFSVRLSFLCVLVQVPVLIS